MFWTNKIKVNLNSRWVSGGYPKLQQSPDRNMYCHLNTVIRNVKHFMSCQEGQCYFVPIHYERICHKLLCIIFAFCHSSHFRNTHVVKKNYTLYIYISSYFTETSNERKRDHVMFVAEALIFGLWSERPFNYIYYMQENAVWWSLYDVTR